MNKITKVLSIILAAFVTLSFSIQGSYAQTAPTYYEGINNLATVSIGDNHIIAVSEDGSAFAWGSNKYGQLGQGNNTDLQEPAELKDLYGITSVAAGSRHSLALKAYGDVYAWGDNSSGQLGIGSTTSSNIPVAVNNLSSIVSIAAGSKHNLALKSDGSVWTWGDNTYGQLGDGSTESKSSPVEVQGLFNIVAVAAGANHSMALSADGTIWTWGDNRNGQLGDGTTTRSLSPKPIKVIENGSISSIAAGANFSLAVSAFGDVYAWGDNTYGQLGDGTTTKRLMPVKINNLPVISSIRPSITSLGNKFSFGQGGVSAGQNHVIAITPMGDVYAWGRNNEGQLGDGTTINRSTPVQVSDLLSASMLAAGGDRSLAIIKNVDVYLWGQDMAKAAVQTPVQIAPKPAATVYVNINIDGNPLSLTVKPRLVNSKTLVPVRDIIEGLGAEVVWDGTNNTVTGIKGDKKIVLKVGSSVALANGSSVTMEVPLQNIDSRTFGQVRTIAEALGAKVDWDSTTNTVNISTNK